MTSVLPLPSPAQPMRLEVGGVDRLPDWVWSLTGFGDCDPTSWLGAGGLRTRVVDRDTHGLVSVRLENARTLPQLDFLAAVEQAYGVLLDTLPDLRAPYPIRIWNVIPGILEPLGDLPQRYMVFNQGRYRAFRARAGNRFESYLPTATGVGNSVDRGHLTIHCVTADRPGEPVENPRQVPAYRYSERFGPRPPCFARATAVHLSLGSEPSPQRRLLIGGTASVRGEDSHHIDDLEAQLDETATNLSALAGQMTGESSLWPGRFEHLRVYHPRSDAADRVSRFVEERLPVAGPVELFSVDICRAELLVEIEGLFAPEDPTDGS